MRVKVGQSLASVVDEATVIVVRAPGRDVDITYGGGALVDPKAGAVPDAPAGSAMPGAGILLGKRYVDSSGDLEVLCTKGGPGDLVADGEPMVTKAAKALPASD